MRANIPGRSDLRRSGARIHGRRPGLRELRANGMSGASNVGGDAGSMGVVEPPPMSSDSDASVGPMARAKVSRKTEKERARALLKAGHGHIAAGRWTAAKPGFGRRG